MIRRSNLGARDAAVAFLGVLVLTAAGCGGTQSAESDANSDVPLAAGLALLPDDPQLHQHVLISDLARLRHAYPEPRGLQDGLVGVWLPDALTGAGRSLWRRAFGLRLAEVSSFAAAGFHPAEVMVAEGEFAPGRMRRALRRSGYRPRGVMLVRGHDGSLDVSTEAGRLSLSSLNRVVASPTRVTAASTTALLRAASSPSDALAAREDFAAAAAVLDPLTSVILLDAELVRPPSGVPIRTLPEYSSRLVGVGIDDSGPRRRTLKIALVYADPSLARSDASLIERGLASTLLPGAAGARFSGIASEWQVAADGRAVLVTALLSANSSPGTWRLLVERGDLAALVRPKD